MNNPAAYTPLESLLLFQSLLAHGVDPGAFTRTSEVLRNNALIKGGETYDPARLNPDALQQLFLLLLRDELKSEAERAEASSGGVDGSTSPTSRKRKLGSPPLPTIADVNEHVEKIPALVDRLYARYRDHIVRQVREDERRFEIVQSQIQLLERSERERIAKLASQNGAAPISRDGKPPSAPSGPTAPTATAQATPSVVRKPPTPVIPPKPPTAAGSIAPPRIASPANPPPGTTALVRPTPSPQPPNGSVLQAPAGVPPPPQRVLQPPAQPPKQAITPRPEAAAKGRDVATTPQPPTPASGGLKWERPYQPLQAVQAPPSGPYQQSPSTPQKAQQHQQTPQQPQHQQQTYQQQQQTPQQLQQPQQRPAPTSQATPVAVAQGQTPSTVARPPARSVLVPPPSAGSVATPVQPGQSRPGVPVPSHARPTSTTPVIPPSRPISSQQAPQTPKPVTSASPTTPAAQPSAVAALQRWQQGHPQQPQQPIPSASPAPPTSLKDKAYASPYVAQPPRPPIPEHMIRQAASTPGPSRRPMAIAMPPQTPIAASPASLTSGFGTKWATHSTPSTPGPLVVAPESPAYEPVSPPQRPALPRETPKSVARQQQAAKPTPKIETSVTKAGRGRPPRSVQKSRGPSTTPSAVGTRRSQSVASQTDELSLDTPAAVTRIKDEEATPRLHEDAGDTTADESAQDRPQVATPTGISSRILKRKRQGTPMISPLPTSQVLWTRGFTKVSSSALDQISSHRDANMFATGVRERDAPNYRQIVLQPQDITSIRSAIKQGNKAAVQAANSLPGGDPGTASVWLPLSEDLVPPKGIINSAQLERELVHMFCNAIMYNPDPDRGPGPAFMKRSQDEEEEVVGYHLDENGVVKNTQSMFLEVEKLLGDLRSAEKERSAPPPSATRMTSVATPADDTQDDEDELAGDGDAGTGTVKRRRITTRG